MMLRKLVRAYRSRSLAKWRREGDLPAFVDAVASQRMRGVEIGKMVRLMGTVDSVNPHLVSIGDYSVIGVHSALLSHCPIRGARPCRVGRFVYVAFGALILPGVSIGDHSIVGAGAVVTRDVPEASIVAGNPARVLRTLTSEERDRVERTMLEGKLFNY